jgi:hypothetical protein
MTTNSSSALVIAERDPDEILRPKKVEQETNVSWNTQKRAKPEAVIQLGKRAVGMKRRDAHRSITR